MRDLFERLNNLKPCQHQLIDQDAKTGKWRCTDCGVPVSPPVEVEYS